MKKLIIVLVLLFAAAALFGQAVQIGSFPPGKWLDSNYDAIWEFSATNIRILDSKTGDELYSFSNKTIQNFQVTPDGRQTGMTFACPDAGRTYSFKAAGTNGDVVMEIDRDGKPKYTVTMKKQ
ncbi:hypothetical protein [Treponema sp. R80B11-R83G3]